MKQREWKSPRREWRIADAALTVGVLSAAAVLRLLLYRADPGDGYVGLLFVLAVACVARWTKGYFWGIFASIFGVACVNYVFTYPYWQLNFTMTGYPLTFLTMLAVSLMISAMTTQIKKQEQMRRETEKETMRANLLRAMSHDIRTPLTSIVGNTAAILENPDAFTPQQQRALLLDVNEDAQWLIRMVENLLSITRISDEPGGIEKEYEAAEEVVAEAVRKFSKRFAQPAVSVQVPDEVLMVPMDATLICQVLMNLLENAAIHADGATGIRVDVHRTGDMACFSVSDDGCGIPPEKLETLFDGTLPDAQRGASDTKKNMGIGLSVCRTIVAAHGGTMSAENLPQGGACLRFTLPMKEEEDVEAEG